MIDVDFVSNVLEGALTLAAERGVAANTTFEQGDVLARRFADASFVAAYAHQVLLHLADPVAALHELRSSCISLTQVRLRRDHCIS